MLDASSTAKEMDQRETLDPVPVTEMEMDESKQQWENQSEEIRGEKRQFPEKEKKVRIPITEKQLTILKKRAKEIINRLDEILDLEFVREIEKRHVSNFISARGDMRHFLKRESSGRDYQPDRQQSQPRNKRPRRAESENSRAWLGAPVRNRRQGRIRDNMAPSWPRPSPNWPQRSEPSINFSRRSAGPEWDPYPRGGPDHQLSSGGGGSSFFLRSDGYQNSGSRGFRSNAPRGRGPRSNAQRPNSARNRRPRRTRDDLYSRCELCNVDLCGEASVKQHMAGKRHRAALQALEGRSPVDQEQERIDPEQGPVDQEHDLVYQEQELVNEEPAPVMHEINIGEEE